MDVGADKHRPRLERAELRGTHDASEVQLVVAPIVRWSELALQRRRVGKRRYRSGRGLCFPG